MKRCSCLLVFVFTVLMLSGQCPRAQAAVKVAVIVDRQVKMVDSAVTGFKDALADGGYKEGQDAAYENYDAGQDISGLQSSKYDIVCAVGTSAVKKAKDRIKDKPLIFTMVLNPVRSDVVRLMSGSGTNITGASLDMPVDVQLKLLKRILPSAIRVGVLYGPRLARLIGEARNLQDELNIKIVPVSVYNSTEVPANLKDLSSGIDVLWLVPDGNVCTRESLSYILSFCMQRKLPVMGFAPNIVKAGALFSYSYDFRDIGRQAGELALKVIAGENPGTIPISVPRKAGYVLNSNTAEYLGIQFPSDIKKGAEETY